MIADVAQVVIAIILMIILIASVALNVWLDR
mgnify:CR=1 FL=1